MGRTALHTSTDDDYNDHHYDNYDNNCAHDDDFEFDINVVNKVVLEYIIYKYVDFHFNNHHDAITARLG